MVYFLPKLFPIILISLSLSLNQVFGKNERIVDGTAATESQFPYHVSIRSNGIHKCGGVIISTNFILTAARCVIKKLSNEGVITYEPENFDIRVGSTNLYMGGILVQVSNIVVHENYNNMLNDLALLKLKEPLIYSDYIKAVTLPYEKPTENTSAIAMGWGLIKPMGDISRNLQWIKMQVIDPINCYSNIFGDEAEKSLLCLKSPVNSGICNGDMGGSAVDGNVLIGLASFAIERCGSEYPDGFTNVAYYVNWIKTNSDLL